MVAAAALIKLSEVIHMDRRALGLRPTLLTGKLGVAELEVLQVRLYPPPLLGANWDQYELNSGDGDGDDDDDDGNDGDDDGFMWDEIFINVLNSTA